MTSMLPVFLLTDFGTRDAYVGQMKAVLTARAPGAPIVDLTHGVSPYAVDEGAWILETALPFLPSPAVVVTVVDPGVGSERLPIAVRAPAGAGDASARYFVGPDNGLLSAAVDPAARLSSLRRRALPAGFEARAITNPEARLEAVSATFHGRDIFAPTAALLARAGAYEALGPALDGIMLLPPFAGLPDAGGGLCGTIIHVDRYGNLVTTLRQEQLPPVFTLMVGGHCIERLVATFSEVPPGVLACHIDSSGFLAVAEREGNAAARTGAVRGDAVLLTPR